MKITIELNSIDSAVEFMEFVSLFHKDREKCDNACDSPLNTFAEVMEDLEDPRFTLRNLRDLANRFDLSTEELTHMLRSNDVEYVTKTKRNTSDQLIGLASRN